MQVGVCVRVCLSVSVYMLPSQACVEKRYKQNQMHKKQIRAAFVDTRLHRRRKMRMPSYDSKQEDDFFNLGLVSYLCSPA